MLNFRFMSGAGGRREGRFAREISGAHGLKAGRGGNERSWILPFQGALNQWAPASSGLTDYLGLHSTVSHSPHDGLSHR